MDFEQHQDLTALVTTLQAEHHVPGISVAVVHGDRTYVVTQGVTSVDDPLEVDADTLFMIGSTTKTLTGTALMALVDQGRLSLTDRLTDHLPEFQLADPQLTESVTVGHLLNHTAGWRGDFESEVGFGDDALQKVVALAPQVVQEFLPGEHVSYNNAALVVAGRLLEVLTGSTYEKAVADLVLAPLGMTNTWFSPWESAQRRTAVGHVVVDDAAKAIKDWPVDRGNGPAGGALSSLRDQVTYARYHLSGADNGPLREETRLQMQQVTAPCASKLDGIGITWLLSHYGDVALVSHGGNISNLQVSSFFLAPELECAVIVMANSKAGATIGNAVLDWALQDLLGVPARVALPTLPLEDPEQYVGTYDLGPWYWSVTAENGSLFAQMCLPDHHPEEIKQAFAAPPMDLVLVGPDQVALAANPVETAGDFGRDESGQIAWFRFGMRFARRA